MLSLVVVDNRPTLKPNICPLIWGLAEFASQKVKPLKTRSFKAILEKLFGKFFDLFRSVSGPEEIASLRPAPIGLVWGGSDTKAEALRRGSKRPGS